MVVAVQGINKLYAKKVFEPGETGSASLAVTTPSLPAGTQLFFTIYADAPVGAAVSWTPAIAGVAQPVNLRIRVPGATADPTGVGVLDAMAGGYHGWSFGEWKSTSPFNEARIRVFPAGGQ